MANKVVRARRKTIAACITCPLCNNLLNDATTISECLHSFCRKCIYDKISEGQECCPICNIDLGCTPLKKLRLDRHLQDVRAKIFPLKRRKLKAPETALPATLAAKRKERSSSRLVVNKPKVLSQSSVTGKRPKAAAKQGLNFPVEKSTEKEDFPTGECPEILGSPESLDEFVQNVRQVAESQTLSFSSYTASSSEDEKQAKTSAKTSGGGSGSVAGHQFVLSDAAKKYTASTEGEGSSFMVTQNLTRSPPPEQEEGDSDVANQLSTLRTKFAAFKEELAQLQMDIAEQGEWMRRAEERRAQELAQFMTYNAGCILAVLETLGLTVKNWDIDLTALSTIPPFHMPLQHKKEADGETRKLLQARGI